MARLFIDCDGVLADFDTFFFSITGWESREYERRFGSDRFWKLIETYRDPAGRGFFQCLPYMEGAVKLLYATKHLNPTILTGAPRGGWAERQKLKWRDQMAPGFEMIVCASRDKRLHMEPGDVLIDDWEQHMSKWVDAGGIWITHTNVDATLSRLHDIHPEWFDEG